MNTENRIKFGAIVAGSLLFFSLFTVTAFAQVPPPGQTDCDRSSRMLADAVEDLRESGEFDEEADLNADAIDEGTAPEEETEETEETEQTAPAPPTITPAQMNNKTVTFTISGYDFEEEEVTAVLRAVNLTALAYTPVEVDGEDGDTISIIAMTNEPLTNNTTNT